MEDKDNQWTLKSPMITLEMESLSTSTVISMDIWQRNAEQKRKNKRPGHALNVTRKSILPETVKESK